MWSFYQFIYVPTLNYGHEFWVATEWNRGRDELSLKDGYHRASAHQNEPIEVVQTSD